MSIDRMSTITTHVLDTVLGKPAAGVGVRLERLERLEGDGWIEIARSATDADGRCRDLTASAAPGVYRLLFDTAAYLTAHGRAGIYPQISVTFTCGSDPHYHLPLLLSDNGYTTYRGS
jgi:5-hydroxyisourate hydrolase